MVNIQTFFIESEATIRLACFATLLVFFLLLEMKKPRRTANAEFKHRRVNNLALLGVDVLVVRLVLPFALFELALWAGKNDIGLFNQFALPLLVNIY